MKKYFLYLLFFSFGINLAYAQASYNILDWKARTTLYNFLTRQLHLRYEQRDNAFAKALQENNLSAYQDSCRKRYFKILGMFPQKASLHPETTGTIQKKGYRIEKIVYESFPNHHVTADLYVPDGEGPFPGVLFFCGHEATAKATITYQQTAILFARHGFVVLSIDPVSQGERYQFTNVQGRPLIRGGTTGHTLLASGSNLAGTSMVAYQLWDNERGLDYLCSRKEVDVLRVGCLGNSGGGTQTAYFMPYDPRVKVAAVCSYITRRERTLLLLGPQDGCQWLPGEGNAGLDISDFLIMFAPKPVLILAGRYDFVDFNGTADVYEELKQVYENMGQPEKIKLAAFDNGHGIQKPKQEAVVRWFKKWLYNDSSEVNEKIIPTLSEQELNVTKTGQVNTAFKNEVTIQSHNLDRADQWKAQRHRLLVDSSPEEYRAMLRKLLVLPVHRQTVADTQQMGVFRKDGFHFQKLILRRAGQPPLPCILGYTSSNRAGRKLVIWFDGNGKDEVIKRDSVMNEHAAKGDVLLLADLRGIGETADDPSFNDKKYYNREYRNAMLALFMNEPLPGQRVKDVFTLLDYCKTDARLKNLPVEINASGIAAPIALYAAALSNDISKVNLYHSIHSYRELLRHPLMKEQYSYVLSGVLEYFDLPDLVAFIGKDKVNFAD